MPINDLFGDCYLITLLSEPQRYERSFRMLWEAGIRSISGWMSNPPVDAGSFKTKGMRGCAESHLGVVKEAKRRELPSVLIAEDDILLWNDFAEKWELVEPVLRQCEWDLFYFYAKESIDIELSMPISLRVNGEPGGHLYAVHSRFYDRYIWAVEKGMKQGKMQDETLYELPDKIVYAIHPPMAGQAAGYSNVIEQNRPERFMPVERTD